LFAAYLTRPKRFQIKLDRRDRRFQFVRNGIEECVLLFAAANFADEKCRVKDKAGYYHRKKYDAENEQRDFANVKQDPTDIQHDRDRDQANAQYQKKYRCSAASHLF